MLRLLCIMYCVLCIVQVKKPGSKIAAEYVTCMKDNGFNKSFSRNTRTEELFTEATGL